MAKKQLFIYIDPGFLNDVGHYKNFAVNIHEEAQRRGIEVWHFVNRDVSKELVNQFKLEKVFQYRAILNDSQIYVTDKYSKLKMLLYGISKKILDPIRSYIKQREIHFPVSYPKALENPKFVKTEQENILDAFSTSLEMILNRLIAKNYQDAAVNIFMYTSHPLYFPIFAKLLKEKKFSDFDINAHLCLFYLNNEFCLKQKSKSYREMLRTVSNLLEWDDHQHRINLYSDSKRTINVYSKYFYRPIKLLPIPLSDGEEIVKKEGSTLQKKITIGFFGYTHPKQGYHLVKKLYDYFIRQEGYKYIQFLVRHNIQFLSPEMEKIVDEFSKATIQIRHYYNQLPDSEYKVLLNESDIVIIPHSRKEYPVQTSGLFVDCLRLKKIVIVPKDTWMFDQLKEYGAGEVFDSDDISSLIRAVKKVINNIEQYKANVGRNIEEFKKFHTAESLFDTLGIRKEKIEKPEVKITDKVKQPVETKPVVMDTNLAKFKNIHRYQRCFIMGNGPSLNKMDLNKLDGEYVFGANAVFLLFNRIKWRPQYYTCVDTRVLPDRSKEIIMMHNEHPHMVCFFPKELIDHQTKIKTPTEQIIPPAPNRLYFEQRVPLMDNLPFSAFSLEPASYLIQPYTVSITALQLAYLLGFEPIYLIGCDTSYVVPKTVLQEGEETDKGKMFYTSTVDDDPNHFSPDYFGKGRKWHNPQVENMIWHYKMAHEALSIAGRHVFNATVGGKLEVFPRVNFDELF